VFLTDTKARKLSKLTRYPTSETTVFRFVRTGFGWRTCNSWVSINSSGTYCVVLGSHSQCFDKGYYHIRLCFCKILYRFHWRSLDQYFAFLVLLRSSIGSQGPSHTCTVLNPWFLLQSVSDLDMEYSCWLSAFPPLIFMWRLIANKSYYQHAVLTDIISSNL
jgi:hypothetical protein